MKRGIMLASVMLFCMTLISQVPEIAKLTAADAATGDHFGTIVSIYSDYAIISAWMDDDNGIDSGSAYIFKREEDTWTQQAKLLPDDGAPGDWFCSVVMSGDYALVGSMMDDDNGIDSGSAYVFKREGDTWVQETKLLPDDGQAGDWFAAYPYMNGDYVVAGSWMDDDNGTDSGSVYIFKREGDSWTQEAKLYADDSEAGDWFGNGVTMSGDYIFASAPYHFYDCGAVYVFKREGDTWTQHAKLLPEDIDAGDEFGSIAAHGDYLLAGSPFDDDNGIDSGSAYIFKRDGDTWVQEAKLVPNDGAPGNWFGYVLAIYGENAIVGAEQASTNGSYSGAAYWFRKEGDTWVQKAKIFPEDGNAGDRFGHSVAIYENTVFIGAHGHDQDLTNSGAVYVYDLAQLDDVPIRELDADAPRISIYPNPGKNIFNITCEGQTAIDQVVLYDMWGSKRLEEELTDNVLEVSGMPAGVYFLEINMDDRKAVKKLIIQ